MAQILAVVLVAALVAFRLLLPPIPGLLKASFQRWGAINTVLLGAASVVCAVTAVLISKS